MGRVPWAQVLHREIAGFTSTSWFTATSCASVPTSVGAGVVNARCGRQSIRPPHLPRRAVRRRKPAAGGTNSLADVQIVSHGGGRPSRKGKPSLAEGELCWRMRLPSVAEGELCSRIGKPSLAEVDT